jgi:hypothetical protein
MYSTVAELRANLPTILSTVYDDTKVGTRITQADINVIVDLSGVVDFDAVDALATVPNVINLLSQYKTAEKVIYANYGLKITTSEIPDIEYWRAQYNTLIDKVIAGEINILDVDGNSVMAGISSFSNYAKNNIRPALGNDKYGEFISKGDLESERPYET